MAVCRKDGRKSGCRQENRFWRLAKESNIQETMSGKKGTEAIDRKLPSFVLHALFILEDFTLFCEYLHKCLSYPRILSFPFLSPPSLLPSILPLFFSFSLPVFLNFQQILIEYLLLTYWTLCKELKIQRRKFYSPGESKEGRKPSGI